MPGAGLLGLLALLAATGEPLTLERAVEMARAHHPSVDLQRAQVSIAEARVVQASAGFLPALTGSVAYLPQTANYAPTPAAARALTRGATTVLDSGGQPVTVSCLTPGLGSCGVLPLPRVSYELTSFWTATVGATWTPWDWGRSIYGHRSARSLAESAGVGVATVQRDVVLEVKLAFFGLVAAEEQVKVGEESVTAFGRQLDQTRAFQAQGLRTGIDVATAESGLAGAQLTLVRARAGVETARARLVAALGQDAWHDWQLVLDPATFELQPGDDQRARAADTALVDVAFRQRTELRQLDLLGQSYRQLGWSARGQYLPALQLAFAPSWAGLDLSSMIPNLTFTVALGFPLGGMSPFLVTGQVREAEGNLRATLAQARAARDAIRQETANAQALLAAGQEEIVAARRLVVAATARRDLATGRYATGIATIIEVTDALLDYVSARFQQVQAGYDLAGARAQMQHALGED